ncbi:HAMP domain-containing protein [Sporosarcina sp. ANT_H38]|uniref:sensor histidine kinase n=1 Tax=Sporosarcina sp. ANT_H38 TaxID=2597358 RepID=UPI0011F0C5D8|nr:ATP-binding protein [Sporosarcina sp. ANT_H38]KAA0941037.1 HAMP domain-containing protein [Sporosarcina sp. ANT_H38]
MNYISLRMRLTVLTGMILIITTILLTVISISIANNKFVQPLTGSIGKDVNFSELQLDEKQEIDLKTPSSLPPDIFFSEEINTVNKQFQFQSLIWMIVIMVGGVGAIYFVAGKALEPVKKLRKSIEDINEHNLSDRINHIPSKDEIGNLASEFNKMLQRLENSFTYQKNFAANAAHELKTPLTIMKTGIQILKLESLPSIDDYKENLEITEESTQRLINIVEDLLMLANNHAVKFSDKIGLQQMFETIAHEVAPLCAEKNITLTLNNCIKSIVGNKVLIYRVFFNLIENAVKYNTMNGKIEITCHVQRDHIRISIADTGIGIAKEELPFIFEPFYRVDQSRTRSLGGSGLGLSIVRSIIEKHKGRIHVKSANNIGTTFEIELLKNWSNANIETHTK